jgi:polysaccharide pyruvyl transferase WcaK-like protein
VVVNQTQDDGAGYLATVTALVDHLSQAHDVLVMAHSARPGRPAGRLNDIPLCATVLEGAARPERCHAVTDGTPGQLRALMSASSLVVTSRFHAMTSALATTTPVVVIGWSHKYREVLREFGHEELAFDFTAVEPHQLMAAVDRALEDGETLTADFLEALPRVREAAERNTAALRRYARR